MRRRTKPIPEVDGSETRSVSLTVNGRLRTIAVEPRTTLLDALRDALALSGTAELDDLAGVVGALRGPRLEGSP